ncbi:MAG: hypothetical protein A4E73_02809 [Syntrophaceae bacterium PtaU1.Bin231]|nr:MAG: hypothetical protein A4E73_02809 [Syntrophaceae bacterium PtaU1.Bin231]
MTIRRDNKENCFVVEGKMSLPNQYFAGKTGSRFIVSLRDGKKILGLKCAKCGKVFVPPREYCGQCWTKIDGNWVELSGQGKIVNYAVVRYNDRHLPARAPYVLAQIQLEGADTPLTHMVAGVDPEEIRIGMRVKPIFAEKAVNTILEIDHFEPV